MIETTVDDLLDGNLDNLNPDMSKIYVVREGDTVFYVGQCRWDILDRLLSHFGKGNWGWAQGPSRLGELILENLPESRSWQIDFLELTDVAEMFPKFVGEWTSNSAEQRLIQMYRPCLNRRGNPDPTPLPEQYRTETEDVVRDNSWQVIAKAQHRDELDSPDDSAGEPDADSPPDL